MKTYEEIAKELDSNIPRDVISKREAAGGRYLDYLEGWYVIDRLNKVLGIGNWAYTSQVSLVERGEIEQRSGKAFSVHYIASVRLVANIGDKKTEFTDYGYGDGTDRGSQGKAHELAVKEAVTDGLKRCAKNLGLSMGLALYDKTREYVNEEKEEEGSNGRDTGVAPHAQGLPPAVHSGGGINRVQTVPKPRIDTKEKTTLDAIHVMQRVIFAKRLTTAQELKARLKEKYGVESSDKLSEDQAKVFLTELQGMVV